MSNSVSVLKNTGLTNRNSSNSSSFSGWPSLLDGVLNNNLPSVFASNFNTGMSLPKVNIRETVDSYFVEMAVPGLNKNDFQIDIENQVLSIATKLEEQEAEQKESTYTRREFGYSSFKRTFTLPETVEDGKIKAKYDTGILSIHLPKKEEAKQKPPRSITIS